MFWRKAWLWIIFLIPLFFITACKIEEIFEETDNPSHLVRVILPLDGLGDLSYSDAIFRGILQAQKESDFCLNYTIPLDIKHAEGIVRGWKEYDDSISIYNIMAGSEYGEIAQLTKPTTRKNNSLMFETPLSDLNITSFHFSGYGVSFLVGIVAYSYTKADTVAYMGGLRNEPFLEECYKGFREGYLYAGGKEVVASYLSESYYGFAMPLKAYHMADSLYKLYPFIYVMAGGSNSGVYQYLREFPAVNGYTAGVDVDQSIYSDRIIGSMIKDIGRTVGDYIHKWMEGEPITSHSKFDLQSGYISFQISKSYMSELEQIVLDNFDIAVKKELEYYKKNE